MDIFNMNFTGNLTGDAVKSEFSDKKIKVYNFTIACNVNEKNTLFLDVAYWAKMKEGAEEDKLLPILVKGKGLTVFSTYATMETTESQKDNKQYQNFQITASRLKI
ncbi:hypothetical protein [Maribacter sp.]|uniref:hypothetical protein n=1 Tax=Maribacter sp. TaxID=1897614 RepID=UPI0025BEACED|nr:hypothetical protein [Maribacter sp.]